MTGMMSGAIIMGDLVAALFFLRYWRDTRDRLFVFFAAAFCLLATQRVWLVFVPPGSYLESVTYLLRAAAFAVIIAGILDKNRSG